MIWLAPWALAAGALGMLGVVAAHLLARQRPRALNLATARFLPAGMLEATTLQRIPIDRWWMLLRLAIIALLALGVAQPVLTGTRVASRTVLLLDRTLPVREQRARLASLGPDDLVIVYDSVATLAPPATVKPDTAPAASLSAALSLLARVRDSLGQRSGSLRIAVASRFGEMGIDPATPIARALLADSIDVLPVRLDTAPAIPRGPITVRAAGDDPIAATAFLIGDTIAPTGAVVQRGPALTADDSSAATGGATVVWWPARGHASDSILRALTVGRTTWIAPLGRDTTGAATHVGSAIGWWADGAPAVWRSTLGRGCIVQVDAALPLAGDQTLSLAAQRWLSALITSCDRAVRAVAPTPAWLSPPPERPSAAPTTSSLASVLAPWLIAAALGLATLELVLRRGRMT